MLHDKQKLTVLIAFNKPPHTLEDMDDISEKAVEGEAQAVHDALQKLGHSPCYLPVFNLIEDIDAIRKIEPDVIFNLCEGFRGNAALEMNLACMWELLDIPYTGNPAITLGLAQNKVLTKKLFQANDILTPEYHVFETVPGGNSFTFPLIAKPSHEDASLGITQRSVVQNHLQLREVVNGLLAKYRQPVLVEEFIPGREFNINFLGNRNPGILPISEIDFSDIDPGHFPITSYEAKWLTDHPLYQKTPSICPADITPELNRRLQDTALRVYSLLGGRDYGRVDVRVNPEGEIFVLEYNPNPDISPDAGYNRALNAHGMAFHEFVNLIIIEAMERNCDDSNSKSEKAGPACHRRNAFSE